MAKAHIKKGDEVVVIAGSELGNRGKVLIVETRPLSKLKRWRLTQIVERAAEAPVPV